MIEMLSPAEAADLLGVTPRTLIRWADEGRVPVARTLGGHRRFARADIEAMIESGPMRTVPATGTAP